MVGIYNVTILLYLSFSLLFKRELSTANVSFYRSGITYITIVLIKRIQFFVGNVI